MARGEYEACTDRQMNSFWKKEAAKVEKKGHRANEGQP
jgi:hypothetical protein